MSQVRPFIWKSPWKQLGWVHKLGQAVSQEITRAQQRMLARLMETQIWWRPESAHQEQGGLKKAIMVPASTLVWEKAAPPAFSLKLDNFVPLHMSFEPFRGAASGLQLRARESVSK